MIDSNVQYMIDEIVARRRISDADLAAFRRWHFAGGVLDEATAAALLAVPARLKERSVDFEEFVIDALTDHIVWQLRPTGRVCADKAAWLIDRAGGPAAVVTDIALFRLIMNVVEEATDIDVSLAEFALMQILRGSISGEGPSADGRVHRPGVLDATDVARIAAIVSRQLSAFGTIGRGEAEIMLELAGRCDADAPDAWAAVLLRAFARCPHVASAPRGWIERFAAREDLNPRVRQALTVAYGDQTLPGGRGYGSSGMPMI